MHIDILKRFEEVCCVKHADILCWFPNGKNSIRVRMYAHPDLIFTYKSKKKWSVQTVDSWLDSQKQEVKDG